MRTPSALIFCCAAAVSSPLSAQQPTPVAAPDSQAPAPDAAPDYVQNVTQLLDAPLVIDATIRDATRIKGAEAQGLAPNHARFYVTAQVGALIRGSQDVPAQIGYIADVPLDWRGRAPKLRKQRVLLLARPVAGKPAMVQLTGPDAQRSWTAEQDAAIRGIVQALLAPDAPPAITGLGNAFHVPGALPGESETQIFLTTANGAPVSLQILRRPGEQPRWAVALGEIVDNAAGPPQRDTLLWYRLACGLPRALPDSSVQAETPENAAAAREDYALVLEALGPCR